MRTEHFLVDTDLGKCFVRVGSSHEDGLSLVIREAESSFSISGAAQHFRFSDQDFQFDAESVKHCLNILDISLQQM